MSTAAVLSNVVSLTADHINMTGVSECVGTLQLLPYADSDLRLQRTGCDGVRDADAGCQ